MRSRLAIWLIGIGTFGILGVSAAAIWLAPENKAEMTRLVLAAVVPLFGTWVGTVLAFYFARENLQAATDSTVRLSQVGSTTTQTPVSTVMIAKASIKAMSVVDTAAAGDLPIQSVMAELDKGPVNRMPILTGAGVVLYVVHRATLMEYANRSTTNPQPSATQAPATQAPATPKLSDLLQLADLAALIKAIGFVREDAVLAEARSAMNSVTSCNDVFVTATGKPDEPMLGWITNTLLAGMQ